MAGTAGSWLGAELRNMTEASSFDLGQFRGREYFLLYRATPSVNDPESFAVTVFYRDVQREENVEIVRVDTGHGYTHIDRLYRRNEPKDRVDWDLWEACTRLKRNWRTYARSFDEK